MEQALDREFYGEIAVTVDHELIFGQSVEVRHISRDQLIRQRHLLSDELDSDQAIFIGLNASGHVYLTANVYRYDGKLLYEKPGLDKSGRLERGLVLRIEDPDSLFQDALSADLKARGASPSITCAAGLCELVNRTTGVKIAKGKGIYAHFSPTELVQKIIQLGLQDKNGRHLKVQVFMIGNGHAEALLKAARNQERRQLALIFHPVVAREVVSRLATALYRAVFGHQSQ